MVGRFVEQQYVGEQCKGECKSSTFAFAAAGFLRGEFGMHTEFVNVLIEFCQNAPLLSFISKLVQFAAQDQTLADTGCLGQDRLLFHILNMQSVLGNSFSVVRQLVTGQNGQQGAFTGAVTADDADTFTGFQRKAGSVKQRQITPGGVHIL